MLSIPTIYKYPLLKALFETMCSKSSQLTRLVSSSYSNPHASITTCTPDDYYWISRHPSNHAINLMMANPSMINLDGLVLNSNPNIGHLLELKMPMFEESHYWIMAKSHNPAVMAFLEAHPDIIDWTILSENVCEYAIRILEKHLDKIEWRPLSYNPSAIEIIKDNLDKIDWDAFSGNTHPDAIIILEQNLDKINRLNLSSNPSAMKIIKNNLVGVDWSGLCMNTNPDAMQILEQNLDKIDRFNLSANPSAMYFLLKHPTLISYSGLLQNPNAISYLETFRSLTEMDYFVLTRNNPNCFSYIEKQLKQGIVFNEVRTRNIIEGLVINQSFESLFDLDYQEMAKQSNKNKLFEYDMMSIFYNPVMYDEQLEHYLENGGTIEDFSFEPQYSQKMKEALAEYKSLH